MSILQRVKHWLLLMVFWRRAPEPEPRGRELPPSPPRIELEPVVEPPHIEPLPAVELSPVEPTPVELPPAPAPRPPLFPQRKPKWAVPKGPLPIPAKPSVPKQPKPTAAAAPKPKPTAAAPAISKDDPEEWGQYYFRDQILDQLDRYFFYLRRMQKGDDDSYALLRQVGIQLMPSSATRNFDKLRDETDIALSPWWREHRPSFGAIAYGFDDVTKAVERFTVADIADESKEPKHKRTAVDDYLRYRPMVITKSGVKYDRKEVAQPRLMWVPRFLYFSKFKMPPTDLEYVSGGDTYKLTVYWDRSDDKVPKRHRKRGGIPQEYGIWIEHNTGNVKVLRSRIQETTRIKWSKGPHGGASHEDTTFVTTHWTVPDRYLAWARMHHHIEPSDYLRRLFIEAATMYETSVLGSMVRIAVSKDNLTATFGVEIKRTPYFFKDRDVVLNDRGTKKRIFHIVRPHVRANGAPVLMHFRGLRDFTWAGYQVAISVPGRDHFALPEFEAGMFDSGEKLPRGTIGSDQLGHMLADYIREGKGGLQ